MSTTVGTLTIEMAANIARLQKDMDAARKSVGTAMGSIEKSIQTAMRSASALFAGVGVSALVGKLVNVQREFDVLNASLITVTGSSADAERAFAWIRDFAATTPYSLNEVTQAFVKMKALGLDASEEALRSYGNTASAMGKSLNQMIEAVADAATGEFERLKEFGIRAKSEGDRVSLTFRGVTTNIGKNAAEIEGYLRRIGDVEFAGAMELRAKTLDGTLSNLADTWDQLFRTIAAGDAGGLITQGAQMALNAIESLIRVIEAMNTVVSSSAAQSRTFSVIMGGLATVFETVAVIGVNVKYVISQIINEVAGLGAQIVALASGNFAEAGRIREQMLAQAEAARREVDMTTKAILDSRNAQSMSAKEIDNDLQRLGNRWIATGSAAALAYKAQLSAATQTARAVVQSNAAQVDSAKDLARQRREELAFGEYMNRVVQERAQEQARLLQEQARLHEESLRPYLAGVQAAKDRVQAMRDEERAIDISQRLNVSLAEAVEMVNIAKLQEKQIDALGNEEAVMALQREIDARNELLGLIRSKEAREANAEAAREAAKNWDRTWDQVSQSMTDALMQGGKSVKDYLISIFRTMVLRPMLQPIVGGMMGTFGMSGAASAATGGAANALGIGAAASTLGSYALTGFMNTVAGTGFSASMAAAGGMTGIASAGMALGAVLAPVAIAAAIGNVLGVFRSTKTVGGGLTGTLGAGDLQSYDLMRKGGSLVSGPSYRLGNQAATAETQALEQAFLTIRSQSAEMARALGISGEEVQRFTMAVGDVRVHPDINQLGLVLDGLSSEQRAAKIAELLQKSADGMAEVILGAGATAQQLAQIYAQAMQERAGLELELLRLQGNVTEIRRRERDALHESNRALYDQIKALEDSKAAAEAATQAERERMQAIMDASAALADAQLRVLELQRRKAIEAAQATNAAAAQMGELSQSLREFVSGQTMSAQQSFATVLKAALGGDAKAMAELPAAATRAVDAARVSATSAAQFRLQQARVMADVLQAADIARQASLATVAVPEVEDEMLAALRELNTLMEGLNKAISIDLLSRFDAINTNLDAGIDQYEFFAAFQGLASEDTLRSVFGALDKDSSGMITRLEAIVKNTGVIATNIGAATAGVIGGTPAQTGMSLAQFTQALQTEAARQGVPSSMVTSSFAGGLFSQLDRNKSNALEASEASAQTISEAVGALLQSQGGGGNGGGSTPAQLTAKDKELLALLKYQSVSRPSSTPGAQIFDMYQKILFRKPERDGLDYWSDLYMRGASLAQIEAEIGRAATTLGIVDKASSMKSISDHYIGLGGSAAGASQFTARFFANGGAFMNGIVSRPTAFDMGVMGEDGPEAIMPLANVNGRLGINAHTPAMDEVVGELQALRSEMAAMRAETRATAVNTGKTKRILERVTRDGEAVQTVAAS